ncbi:MAG: hypothetical protein R3B09_14070 [Nannocystaceae bacterium]
MSDAAEFTTDDESRPPGLPAVDVALEILDHGGEQSRRRLLRMIEQTDAQALGPLRGRLCALLRADLHHRVDDEAYSGSWARAWQVSALVAAAGADAECRALMDAEVDRAREPNRWVRYWTLASAIGREEHRGWALAVAGRFAVDRDEGLLVRALAWAILAEHQNDARAADALLWALRGATGEFSGEGALPIVHGREVGEPAIAAALRALRIVPLLRAFDDVEKIVDAGPFAPHTWDALWVLGRYRGSARAAEASHTLARFVVAHRRRREYYEMVGFAIRAIGALGVPQTDLLLAELDSSSAGVFVEAARALERLLGAEKAVSHLVDLHVVDPGQEVRLADALRCMRRVDVVDALDRALRCGIQRREAAARLLLVEVGGSVAMDRVQVRRQDLEVRRKVAAELDVRQREHVRLIALGDGAATWISMGMWIAVFLLGFTAVAIGLVLIFREPFGVWSGWVLAGSGGLFALLGKLGFNGRMVEAAGARAAARLALFTGYQRRLQHIDLLLAQRFIDGSPVSLQEIDAIGRQITNAQREAQESLLALMPSEREVVEYRRRRAVIEGGGAPTSGSSPGPTIGAGP